MVPIFCFHSLRAPGTTQEQEKKRCQEELAHIRTKFSAPGKMDAYDRKKYMWKVRLGLALLVSVISFSARATCHMVA